MAMKIPRKNVTPKSGKSAKAPGKTILPRKKAVNKSQRRFSLIDSDSSSLSEFESDDDEELATNSNNINNNNNNNFTNTKNNNGYGEKFHALQSESEDEDDDDDDDSSSDNNEQLWQSHGNKVVNTSSEDEDDDDDNEDEDQEDSSSSDDEDVDFVKLTAERKARSMEAYRSQSPFQSPQPSVSIQAQYQSSKKKQSQKSKLQHHDNDELNFSFDWNNNNDHLLRMDDDQEDEEEDVGEELSEVISPLKMEIPITGEPIGIVAIEDSESDADIDRDLLLRTLEQDSDGLNSGIDTGEDDFNLLQEEADNILQDYSSGQLELSSNTTPRHSVVEDMIRKHKAEVNPDEEALQFVSEDEYYDDDDDDDDDDYGDDFIIPFFDDTAFKEKLLYTSEGAINDTHITRRKDHGDDSEDDSYLWDYFFSDGEGDDDDDDDNQDQNNKTGEGHHDNYSDDEATDEDTTLPPPSTRRKVGAKAQELLSSSSIIARPPQLGTWSTDSKPFGIIDGLSTRSLLLTPTKSSLPGTNSNGLKAPSTPVPGNSEEFTLDELLNMSELEDSEPEGAMDHAAWLEVTSSSRKVPLSAFRNKGVMSNEALHVNARRFSSSAHTGSGGKHKSIKKKQSRQLMEVGSLTPVRAISKHGKKRRAGSMKKARGQSVAEAAVEGLRVTKGGLFSEDTLTNVEEFLTGLGGEAELSILLQ